MSYYNCNGRSGCGCNSCSDILGTNNCGCGNNSCSGNHSGSYGCSGNGVYSANTNSCLQRHGYPFPPIGSVCGTCPAGTRPCSCCGGHCGCGNTNGCGCGCGCHNSCTNQSNPGSYAFFNSTGSTITTGSIIPLRYVIGSGELGRGTTGGTVNLDCGVYSVEYSLGATADTAGAIITVTPEYLGALHPEYARSFTTSAAGQSFDIAEAFVINLPTDTTLSLNVTITEPEATSTTTLTAANASMLIRRISCYGNS